MIEQHRVVETMHVCDTRVRKRTGRLETPFRTLVDEAPSVSRTNHHPLLHDDGLSGWQSDESRL